MIDMPNVDEAIKDKVNEDQQAVQSDKSLHGPFYNFDENTLFIFDRSSKFRFLCYSILKSR